MKLLFVFSTLILSLLLAACSESNSHKGQPPIVMREGFTNGSCFDVSQLEAMIKGPLASQAVQVVTTAFEAVGSDSEAVDLLMDYKVFGVQRMDGKNLGLIPHVLKQNGCTSAEFRSAGGPMLKYRVTMSSIDRLVLKLSKGSGDASPEYRRDSLTSSPQPSAYDFKLLDGNHLEVIMTYQSFNPTCNSDKLFTYRIKKLIEWQNSEDKLATTVSIDRGYMNRYLTTLQAPPPMMEKDQFTIAEITTLAKQAARPELLSCHM